MFRTGSRGNGCLCWLWTAICHRSITWLRLPVALLGRLIADWPQGCKRGPLIPVPLLLVDPLPFLKSAWLFLGSWAACSVDSDGWAVAMGCCITPPPAPGTTTTPSASDAGTPDYGPQRQTAVKTFEHYYWHSACKGEGEQSHISI